MFGTIRPSVQSGIRIAQSFPCFHGLQPTCLGTQSSGTMSCAGTSAIDGTGHRLKSTAWTLLAFTRFMMK